MSTLSIDGAFGQFADRLLRTELPDQPAERRAETVEFTCRRANQMPTPLRLGVIVLAIGVTAAARMIGDERLIIWITATRLPVVGELPRMVRSLAFAYVWETWPMSLPTGAPGDEAVA